LGTQLCRSSGFDSHEERKLELPGQRVPKLELGNERKIPLSLDGRGLG
jgi:hypothetical protein